MLQGYTVRSRVQLPGSAVPEENHRGAGGTDPRRASGYSSEYMIFEKGRLIDLGRLSALSDVEADHRAGGGSLGVAEARST